MLSPKVPIAQEGYPFIGLAVFTTLFLTLSGLTLLSYCSFVITLFVLSFFRDPERFVPTDENAIVSPADGKIIIAERVNDEQFTSNEALKISIFMNVFNVHVNRVPFAGTVEKIHYKPGKFYSADSVKGGLENEYCATIFSTSRGQSIACVQIAGLIARRIVCWLEPGDKIVKGHRMGLIRFGSRVDLYLPVEANITVKIGDKVRAGETVVATIP